MVAVSLEDLKSGVGQATLGDTGRISAAEARIHACDCKIIPAVLGDKSEPLNLGRLRRLVSPGLRRALYLRDRGCAFPGCHRPPRHCQGHHIRHVRHEALFVSSGGERPPTLDRHSGSVKLRAA
jgi:hypothetical protein